MKQRLERLQVFLEGPNGCWLVLLSIVAFSLPVTIPTFQSYFSFDDLQNLYYYTRNPAKSLLGNVIVFTSGRRPAGALFYLTFYYLFGMNPLPLYIAGFVLFNLNIALVFFFTLRLTRSRIAAVAAAVAPAFHPHVHNVLFNFGAVYELLALTCLLGALHCYLSLRRGKWAWGWYGATLLFFLLGLNAKETVVVLPALLLAYEALYSAHRLRNREWFRHVLISNAPFWLAAVAYTLVKTLGKEAFWRENPLYRFHFDWTFYRNITSYLNELAYGTYTFSAISTAVFLALLVAVSLLLSRRDSVFGLTFAFLTLLPVLFLPRVWGLFLYLPLVGVGIYIGSVAAEALRRFAKRIDARVPIQQRWRTALSVLVLLVFLRGALVYSAPRVRYAREVHYFQKGRSWRPFAEQLWSMYPNLAGSQVLVFQNPPFDPENEDQWCLHFLVWLRYQEQFRIYRLPQQLEEFLGARHRFVRLHFFDWEDGRLVERNVDEVDLE